MARLEPGDPAPAFNLVADDDSKVTLRELIAEARRRKAPGVVVYFYPKDDTPGCTKEACQFDELLGDFEALGVPVVGISPDPPESHRRFKAKHGLRFPLLSDPSHETMEAYGAWGEKRLYGRTTTGVVRSTIVVGTDGKVRAAWYQVRADGHAAKVLDALQAAS
jgi:peroxiredoxin Q/BCP